MMDHSCRYDVNIGVDGKGVFLVCMVQVNSYRSVRWMTIGLLFSFFP